MRSVGRGAGAACQSQPLDVLALSNLALDDAPLVAGGPWAPFDCVVCGTLFLLLEIELSAARGGHVSIAEDRSSATWLLPTSKTDPRAVGVSRSWDCTCSVPGMKRVCPVCALGRQLERLGHLAQRCGVAQDALPLFPTVDGAAVDKHAMISTINALVTRLNRPVRDASGC